ncbi:unnamed protein product [Linum trigynum]|uniref:Uncharacterized protein n=1 Tax=Linum trigynum TaxID=586398 RepID=A0AAV2DAG0_9ROSI
MDGIGRRESLFGDHCHLSQDLPSMKKNEAERHDRDGDFQLSGRRRRPRRPRRSVLLLMAPVMGEMRIGTEMAENWRRRKLLFGCTDSDAAVAGETGR